MITLEQAKQTIAENEIFLTGYEGLGPINEWSNAEGPSHETSSRDEHIFGIGTVSHKGETRLGVMHDYEVGNLQPLRNFQRKYKQYPIWFIRTKKPELYLAPGSPIIDHQQYQPNVYGTLGGFAYDRDSEKLLMISNNHVIANCNNAPIGTEIMDCEANVVCGSLCKYVPLLPPPNRNTVDAAAGFVYRGSSISDTNLPDATTVAIRGQSVYKIGATSGYTTGRIIATDAATPVPYPNLGLLNFNDIILIEGTAGPFAEPGDSGSFVYSSGGRLIGIVFAGTRDRKYTYACKISNVMNQLRIYFG